ncbi:unnamed protein product [Echinostoma caproni]|uniref:Uncharacterized protein n=1 Tax=Echinostoma caproni TaxID=27848 RepID=A0A183BG68_9TREM|nr:unnamed protein product [Echinostoma caproni]
MGSVQEDKQLNHILVDWTFKNRPMIVCCLLYFHDFPNRLNYIHSSSWLYPALRYSVGFQSDTEFALFDFDSYSEYYNWRRNMDLRTIESLKLHSHLSEIEEWIERFQLWCSLRQNGKQDQSTLFLTVGGEEMYFLLKNFAFPDNPVKLPFPIVKRLLLSHLILVDFQADEMAQFNLLVRAESMFCRDFILLLNKQASKCNYENRLEEQLCDRLFVGINNVNLQRKLLKKRI